MRHCAGINNALSGSPTWSAIERVLANHARGQGHRSIRRLRLHFSAAARFAPRRSCACDGAHGDIHAVITSLDGHLIRTDYAEVSGSCRWPLDQPVDAGGLTGRRYRASRPERPARRIRPTRDLLEEKAQPEVSLGADRVDQASG
jgi:hypothetical protein